MLTAGNTSENTRSDKFRDMPNAYDSLRWTCHSLYGHCTYSEESILGNLVLVDVILRSVYRMFIEP